MNKILQLISQNPAVELLRKGKGRLITSDILDEAYLLASAYQREPRPYVIVKSNLYEASQLYQALSGLVEEGACLYFPMDESMRMEVLATSPEMQAERIQTYQALTTRENYLLITHTHALLRHIPSSKTFTEFRLNIRVGDTVEMSDLKRQLIQMGYQYIVKVDEPFYFSYRGGIIDVYSVNYEQPIRIEFFDNEIDSIRLFDTASQRTSETLDEVTILPATDLLYQDADVAPAIQEITEVYNRCFQKLDPDRQDELDDRYHLDMENLRNHDTSSPMAKYYRYFGRSSSILDYCPEATILLSSESGVKKNHRMLAEEAFSYQLEMFEEGRMLLGLEIYEDLETLLAKHNKRLISVENFKTKSSDVVFEARAIDPFIGKEELMLKRLRDFTSIEKVLMILPSESLIRNMTELLDSHLFKVHLLSENDPLLSGVNIMKGDLAFGVELLYEKVAVLTPRELFGQIKPRKKSFVKYKNARVLKDFDDLQVGDYIVHDVHGIGQYLGIKTLEVSGNHRDYLYIAYRGNDTLYIPVEQFKMIRKYTSREGKVPKLNKLGGTEWAKTKQRIKKKADGLADSLIQLYAQRMSQPGFAFGPDGPDQLAFEASFGYELTDDQAQAVQEIKHDMMLPRPMDRLLCGDVGFGKTEVALRAAFKAIESHKQVVMLCPTTILSSQHYRTMIDRFNDFPVEVALLNRFVSAKHTKEILTKLKEGTIDILVGTHRVLSKDVQFKDLGLLIVDEEQRFGVRHKEKIKEMKKTIDVLTLTATPIPRTLQMSLMGIRGLSTINTPPENRLPVQTYVVEKSPTMIKQIIERELARQGQVFYLYNRTEDIDAVAMHLEQTIPNAKVGVGHGKMDKADLEDVMMKFINQDYNILVCTTIIETGIDIPNANTIIIEDADHFGLSQLYQIRGRVGRSDRYAYAYLLHRPNKEMTPEATKRLKAIKEFTELGSGYKIAMRDLNIRGAGDILGGEQAGFIDSVGFDMFMRILQEVIDEKTGKTEEKEEIPSINLTTDGYIPQNYVDSDLEKLRLYQRLDEADDIAHLDEVKAELTDLYGKLPREVATLVEKREFDILCHDDRIDHVSEQKNGVEVTLSRELTSHTDGNLLMELVTQLSRNIRIAYTFDKITLKFPKEGEWLGTMNLFLRQVDRFVKG